MSDIVLEQFAASAKRFAAAADAAVATHGDEALGGKPALTSDLLRLRSELGMMTESYRLVQTHAPEAMSTVSDDLRGRMSTAMRAAESTHATWHLGRGTSSVASLAALADAAQGVAEVARTAAPTVRPVRVVVGGNGPAGLATANLLREAGADVRVVAPVAQARTGSLMVDRRAWGVLERAGGRRIVADAPIDRTGNYKMASTRSIEQELGSRAHAIGVRVDAGHSVAGVEHTEDGVRVALSRQQAPEGLEYVTADWYVDATGGRSPVAMSEPFRRETFHGPYGALPAERSFIAASAKALDDRPLGWTAADGSFAINDVDEGILTAYRGMDVADASATITPEQATKLLQALDVDPTTMIGTPWSFTAQQTLARSAGEGRVLIVGDGAGTVMPVTQAGVFLALTDAERAARTIITARVATREAIGEAVAEINRQSTLGWSDRNTIHGVLDRVADDAGDIATEATERATRTHDEQTRAMHRVFLS